MSYHFIDKKDPRIDVMFQGLEKMERMLSVMEDVPRSSLTIWCKGRHSIKSPIS